MCTFDGFSHHSRGTLLVLLHTPPSGARLGYCGFDAFTARLAVGDARACLAVSSHLVAPFAAFSEAMLLEVGRVEAYAPQCCSRGRVDKLALFRGRLCEDYGLLGLSAL